MDEQDFEEVRVELWGILADIGLGKFESSLETINKRIIYFNKIIDQMPVGKNIQDYLVIDLCHQYYRVKVDVLLSSSNN